MSSAWRIFSCTLLNCKKSWCAKHTRSYRGPNKRVREPRTAKVEEDATLKSHCNIMSYFFRTFVELVKLVLHLFFPLLYLCLIVSYITLHLYLWHLTLVLLLVSHFCQTLAKLLSHFIYSCVTTLAPFLYHLCHTSFKLVTLVSHFYNTCVALCLPCMIPVSFCAVYMIKIIRVHCG